MHPCSLLHHQHHPASLQSMRPLLQSPTCKPLKHNSSGASLHRQLLLPRCQ
jgi:hypothetical protein